MKNVDAIIIIISIGIIITSIGYFKKAFSFQKQAFVWIDSNAILS